MLFDAHMKHAIAAIVTLGVATATHLDWHAARPTVHHLSLGLSWHWLLAVPVFALTAWYVMRAWPARRAAASIAILGIGLFIGAVVEPAYELWIDGADLEWTFGPARNAAALAFTGTGLVTYVVTMALGSHRHR
jgi:hypothetical protein